MSLADFTIHPVDPREAGWIARVLFKHDVRFCIYMDENLHWLAKLAAMKKLSQGAGEEGEDWHAGDDGEVYCRSITFLMMARLSEDDEYEKFITRIEERTDEL